MKKYDPVDYLTRVTTAIQSSKWDAALLALHGARSSSQMPKQGTVQRWVRFCDTAEEWMRLRLIESILRVAGGALSVTDDHASSSWIGPSQPKEPVDAIHTYQTTLNTTGVSVIGAGIEHSHPAPPTRYEAAAGTHPKPLAVQTDPVYQSRMEIRRFGAWVPQPIESQAGTRQALTTKEMLDGEIVSQRSKSDGYSPRGSEEQRTGADGDGPPAAKTKVLASDQFTIILEEKAADRQPPNHHDLRM
jgi:hypothetical protein